jgi:hypothetical protein
VELFDPVDGVSAQGGFLDLSTDAFSPDPMAAVVRVGAWDLLKTTATPVLYGVSNALYGQITFDRQVGRWLPVARSQVAPDGLSYAYAEWFSSTTTPCPRQCIPQPTGGRIHVTDPRSGADTIVFSFTGDPAYQVVGYAGNSIFMRTESPSGANADQLWRFDLSSRSLTKVVEEAGSSWIVDEQHLWMVTLGNGDIAPVQLNRIDLTTGVTETWFNLPARSASNPYSPSLLLLGLDAQGAPWVALNSRNPSPLLRLVAAGHADQIFAADGPYTETVSNLRGSWFGVVDNAVPTPSMLGLYLYSAQRGVQLISNLHLMPV